MSLPALLLILLAAFCHAGWNYLAKRSTGGAAFVWLFSALSALLYLPLAVAVLVWVKPHLGAVELAAVAVSGALHLVYYLTLQRGYRVGDLSLVYPIARSAGPLLAVAGAVLLLGERPAPLALAGGGLVVLGVLLVTAGRRSGRAPGRAASLGFGLATGLCIAVYTLWDAHALTALLIPPLLLDYGATLARLLYMAPWALRHHRAVAAEWQRCRAEAVGVALLSPLAYILVLVALTFTPVSYVAPAREVSVLVAVLLGGRLLREAQLARRLGGAAVMLAGLLLLAAPQALSSSPSGGSHAGGSPGGSQTGGSSAAAAVSR